MRRLLTGGTIVTVALAVAGLAEAQTYPPPPVTWTVQPAPPETMPTVSPYSGRLDDLSGTSTPTISATPDCGAANPQDGIPSMTTGNCP